MPSGFWRAFGRIDWQQNGGNMNIRNELNRLVGRLPDLIKDVMDWTWPDFGKKTEFIFLNLIFSTCH